MKKNLLFFLFLIVFALMVPSCKGTPPAQVPDSPVAMDDGEPESIDDGLPVAEMPDEAEILEDEEGLESDDFALVDVETDAETDTDIEEELAMEEVPLEDLEPVAIADAPPAAPEPVPSLPALPPAPPPVPPPAPPAPPPPRVVPPPAVPPAASAPSSPPGLIVPPAVPLPDPEEQPPAIVRERLPRIAPELAVPSQGFTAQQDDRVAFSRSVRATVGQIVEVPFRGTGWVYTGEAAARRGIVYESRQLDTEGQTFVFRTEAPGTYTLRFYRQDFIRDYIINDHVQVIVTEAPESVGLGLFVPPADQSRVVAEPRWPSPADEAQRPETRDGTATPAPTVPPQPPVTVRPPATPATPAPAIPPPVTVRPPEPAPDPQAVPAEPATPAVVPPATPPPVAEPVFEMPEGSSPDEYLRKAREEYEAGRITSAISVLDQFMSRYPSGSDEAFWLYAQCYEANGPNRNILASLEYYRRLVQEYPQSSRTSESRRRIAYLQRYYINIQ